MEKIFSQTKRSQIHNLGENLRSLVICTQQLEIQFKNSIDAHDGGDQPVVVETGIHDGSNSLSRDVVSEYFGEELKRHINAKENNVAEISQSERIKLSPKIAVIS